MLSAKINGREVVRGSRMFSQVHGWGTVACVEWDRIRFLPDDPRYRHWYAFTLNGHHAHHYNGQVLFWSDRKDGDKSLVKATKGVPANVVNKVKGQEVTAVKSGSQAFTQVAFPNVKAKQVPFYQMVFKDKNGRFGMSKAHYQSIAQAQAALDKVLPGARVEYPYLPSKIMVNV